MKRGLALMVALLALAITVSANTASRNQSADTDRPAREAFLARTPRK